MLRPQSTILLPWKPTIWTALFYSCGNSIGTNENLIQEEINKGLIYGNSF